jgi:hypothetical protein
MSPDLIRIEYKLDLIIRALQHRELMLSSLPDLSGIQGDTCALCEQPVQIRINAQAEELDRLCGCKLPVQVVRGISTLATPIEVTNADHQQRESNEVSSDAPEGSDRKR